MECQGNLLHHGGNISNLKESSTVVPHSSAGWTGTVTAGGQVPILITCLQYLPLFLSSDPLRV